MRKTIEVRPVNEILIKFKNKEYVCTFNLRAMSYMQQELYSIGEGISEICTEHFAAIILYSGIKANDDTYTLEEAKALALSINPSDLNDIIAAYNESNGIENDIDVEDSLAKKILAQILLKMAKSK